MRRIPIIVLVLASAAPVFAQVVSSDFLALPSEEGWTSTVKSCDPVTSVANSIYHQQLDMSACPGEPTGAQDPWTRMIEEFNGIDAWFYEFKVQATADQSEIQFGAPTVLAAFNSSGIGYNATVASDQVKLFRNVGLPVLFFDLEVGVPHTVRLELDNTPPETYRWIIDGVTVDDGLAVGSYPAAASRITWQGRSAQQPTCNDWYHIRFGSLDTGIPTVSHWGLTS